MLQFSPLTRSSLLATKFIIGAGVGIPASTLCINRRLYKIAALSAVSISRNDVRALWASAMLDLTRQFSSVVELYSSILQ